MKRKTSKKKFNKKIKELSMKIKSMRQFRVADIIAYLNKVLTGYYNYYGITDNSRSLSNFLEKLKHKLFYWLNRRSQRRSHSWDSFNELLKHMPLKQPRIRVSIY